jgi:hypothetical protein
VNNQNLELEKILMQNNLLIQTWTVCLPSILHCACIPNGMLRSAEKTINPNPAFYGMQPNNKNKTQEKHHKKTDIQRRIIRF